MFSGIVEAVEVLTSFKKKNGSVQISIKKPSDFDDLKNGDSIAVNGICLTLEAYDHQQMTFSLAAETLLVLGLEVDSMQGMKVNLERSMRLGDRIHGSLVTGHIEALGKIIKSEASGDSWLLSVKLPSSLAGLVWKKGSITLQGVNLTVNQVVDGVIDVCLVPETIKRTNLTFFKVGQMLNVEPDYFAKAVLHHLKGKQLGNSY